MAGTAVASLLIAGVALTPAAVLQSGNLRLTLLSQILPNKLPRTEKAPIAVFVSGHVEAVKSEVPSQLRSLAIKVNRHGQLQSKGLPACPVSRIQPSSTEDAVERCGQAVVGSGQFWAHIVFPGQDPYPTRGRLLVFNGRTRGGRPALLAHIYTANPFATSFVIAFRLKRIDEGAYGTELSAALPRALGEWGYVDRIKLTLRRKYHYQGQTRSYFNANCPAPADTQIASYPIALATFSFEQEGGFSLRVNKSCKVKGP